MSPVAIAAIALAACDGEPSADHEPPSFDGLVAAVVVTAGTAALSWDAATDRSLPIVYRVWTAGTPGGESFFDEPAATTTATSIEIAGLPDGIQSTYFVVRARDAAGNEDENVVERSVAFAPNRLERIGGYPLPTGGDIAVNSAGNLVAVSGFVSDPQVRAWVFDLSDPAQPELKATLLGEGRSTDVEIRGDVLWVSVEDGPGDAGAFAYDLSDPDDVPQVPIGEVRGDGTDQDCHTIWLHGTVLYCASTFDEEIHLYDVSDPASPDHLSSVGIPGEQVHDVYVDDELAVGAFLYGGLAFFDVSNLADPSMQQRIDYAGAFTHNVWPTADHDYLYTTDENAAGHLRIWDIRNRDRVEQVGEYYAYRGPGPKPIVHNVQIVGSIAYVSWYEAGVQVLDVSDPTDPVLVGFHDTYVPTTLGTYRGAWGVAPKPPYLFVSDLDSGLHVFRLNE